MSDEKNLGEPVPVACAGCQRLQVLVNKIIHAAIHFLVMLKIGGAKNVTDEIYAKYYEQASLIFMQHLRDVGLLPKAKVTSNGKDPH